MNSNAKAENKQKMRSNVSVESNPNIDIILCDKSNFG
jgi:hypothetical protein